MPLHGNGRGRLGDRPLGPLPPPQPPEAHRGRQMLHGPGQDKGAAHFNALSTHKALQKRSIKFNLICFLVFYLC